MLPSLPQLIGSVIFPLIGVGEFHDKTFDRGRKRVHMTTKEVVRPCVLITRQEAGRQRLVSSIASIVQMTVKQDVEET